ncbi:MAG: alpha-amylase family glycosyl hydrolase [Byssovorax sp.]
MKSRDFRADTLYFIVTDRFANGDPDNDLGDNPACSDPTRKNWLRYWGGDLQGILDRLGYLEALGVSAIWITPIFEQIDAIADDAGRLTAPYHGYWARDFKRIDEHLLPRAEWRRPFADRTTLFDRLLAEAHARDIRVLLDVVCNHTSAGAPGAPKGELYDDGAFLTSYDDDRLGWYNRFGPIRDWDSPHELAKGELRGLADLNEDVWSFRRYITETMAAWLDRGVDGFRLDAVKHMSLSFWQEFTATMRKHRPDVVLFGEWSGIGPWDSRGMHFARSAGMSVLDFNFHYGAHDVFCKNAHFRRFVEVLAHDHGYDDATELVTFLDNHDTPRLLSVGMPVEHLPLAVTLLLTSRGVPCLFYGTEQALFDATDGGQDPYNRPMMERFDLDTPVARILPRLAALRRRSLAVQRGYTRELFVGQDVFAFARAYHRSSVVVILNRGKAAHLTLAGVPLPDGRYADLLGALAHPVEIAREALSLDVPAGAAVVLEHHEALPEARARVVVRLNGYASRYGERVVVLGDAPELGRWDPSRAVPLHYVNENLWTGDLLFDESAGAEVLYRFGVIDQGGTIRHEDRMPRLLRVPEGGVLTTKDRWQT